MSTKIKPADFAYYQYNKLYSMNAVLNIAIGGRGVGKTYGAKKKTIKDAIRTFLIDPETSDQFIYLRRYKPEIQLSKLTYFAKVGMEFPEWDFKVDGFEAKMAHIDTREDKKRKWHTIGYFIALVNGQNYKGVEFPRVKTIIFDEFIIEKGHMQYLVNEATALLNFYVTVDRNQEKTRVLLLANSVSIDNPYFIEYGIEPKNADKEGFLKSHGGFIAVHFIDAAEYRAQVYETRLGKFIQDTEYGDYAMGNEFADNHNALLGRKGYKDEYLFTLEAKSGIFSVWYDKDSMTYFVQPKRPKGGERFYTLLPEKMSEEKILADFSDKMLSRLRTAYKRARVTFHNAPTRNSFMEIFKR